MYGEIQVRDPSAGCYAHTKQEYFWNSREEVCVWEEGGGGPQLFLVTRRMTIQTELHTPY